MILLTHLYNDQHPYLIIDEPELNLHPQFQAFFIQEARKIAGSYIPGTEIKTLFLITHSPFMVDLRNVDDLRSVISFNLKYELPQTLTDLDISATTRLTSLVPRLNVHHKQLFFSDNPIFVEEFSMLKLFKQYRSIATRRSPLLAVASSTLAGAKKLTNTLNCVVASENRHSSSTISTVYSQEISGNVLNLKLR